MSRVEEDYRARQAEAERAAKGADKAAREARAKDTDRQAFGNILKDQQHAAQATTRQQGERTQVKHETRAGTERQAQAAAGAKGKIAAAKQQAVAEMGEGLAATARAVRQETAGRVEGDLTTRQSEGIENDRVQRTDQREDVQRRDAEDEVQGELRSDRGHDAREVAAGSPKTTDPVVVDQEGSKRGQQERQRQDQEQQQQQEAIEAAAAGGASAPPTTDRVPREWLEKIAATVYLAVTQRGLKEFQVELKDGVLSGALLKVSVDRGQVHLSFSGLDDDERRLLEGEKGRLMRRLDKKGLSLGRFELS